MLGLIDLEVKNFIFDITKENNKFEIYVDTSDEFSFTELKDEVGEILNIPNITDELDPGNYTIEDLQKIVYSLDIHEGSLQIEYDDSNKKVKLMFNTMVEQKIGALRFDKKSFFHTLLVFDPYWDYKPTNSIHADSPDFCTSDKIILNSNTIDKIHLKCDCIDGSIQDGIRQLILFSFVLDKPSGYKVFCEPETIHYKKINKSVLTTTTFHIEDDHNEEVNFNGETLTFTLQMIKI